METKNELINQFIIDVSLIEPVQKIINQLENGEFRNCDLKWLENKLENFVEFAAKTLNINGVISQPESVKPAYMNEYAVKYYLKYFNQLLDYFKSI